MMIRWSGCALLLAAVTVTAPAAAQVSSASTAALGMADNYTAAARGYNAVAWNPAGLGLSGNPGASFVFIAPRITAGIGPVTLKDIKDWQDKLVPTDVKTAWLASIKTQGGEQGTGGFDVNYLALSIGRIGFQLSSSGRTIANISPGIAQLILFGNTDASGTPQTISLNNSTTETNVYSTGALSFAPFVKQMGTSRLSVGLTGKYTIGQLMAIGSQSTGNASVDPLQVTVTFPIVHTPLSDTEGGFSANNGNGFGLDIGAGLETGKLTVGAAIQNVVNSFKWDQSKLFYVPGTATFNQDTSFSNTDSKAYTTAGAAVPAALRTRVDALKFKPVVAAGAQYRVSRKVMATADVRMGSADGIFTGPKSHFGVGAEIRPLGWIPLRVGVASIKLDDNTSGTEIAAGAGLNLIGFNLAASVARRKTDLSTDNIVMLTILSRGM